MTIEAAFNYPSDLNASNPAAGDVLTEGDDHIRGLKTCFKTTLPNVTGAITATQAELNILDGATLTTTELNYVDGVTSAIQTQLSSKLSMTSAGVLTQVGTTKTGGGTSYDLTGISSTYNYYTLEIIKLLPATDGALLYLLTSTDGGSNWGSSYTWQASWGNSVAPYADSGGSAAAQINLGGSGFTIGNAANELGVSGHVEIWKPSDAAYCHISWELIYRAASDGSLTKVSGSAFREAVADVDAVRLIFSSGNITSGTARLFGRN